jgi:hypothetical protein
MPFGDPDTRRAACFARQRIGAARKKIPTLNAHGRRDDLPKGSDELTVHPCPQERHRNHRTTPSLA